MKKMRVYRLWSKSFHISLYLARAPDVAIGAHVLSLRTVLRRRQNLSIGNALRVEATAATSAEHPTNVHVGHARRLLLPGEGALAGVDAARVPAERSREGVRPPEHVVHLVDLGRVPGRYVPVEGRRAAEHAPHALDLGRVPSRQVGVEGPGVGERVGHILDRGGVPPGQVGGEGFCTLEHADEDLDLGHVPAGNVLVERRGVVEHGALKLSWNSG